ncbi:mucin-5AC-like [Penaeus japonicus]|uniref:mucin-5AC-like n=1 Tax=Penaeus japonicus TaxID=27405 RepID=UPI001C7129E3|nr:mucin-5AC-like [Penaeus japonicus]
MKPIWVVWALGVVWVAGARAVPLPQTGPQQETDPALSLSLQDPQPDQLQDSPSVASPLTGQSDGPAGASGDVLLRPALGKPVDVVRLVHPSLSQGVASLEELGFSQQSRQGPDREDHFGIGTTQGLGGFGEGGGFGRGEFGSTGGFGSGEFRSAGVGFGRGEFGSTGGFGSGEFRSAGGGFGRGEFGSTGGFGSGEFRGGFGNGDFRGTGGFGSGEVFSARSFPQSGFQNGAHNFGFNHPGFHNGFAGLGFGDPGFINGGAPGFAQTGAFGFPNFGGGNFNGFNTGGSFGGFNARPFSLSTGSFNPAAVPQPTRVIVQTVPVVVDIVNRTHGSLIPHSQAPTNALAPSPAEARTNFGGGFFNPGFGGFHQQVNNVDPIPLPPSFDSQLEGGTGEAKLKNSEHDVGADISQGSASNPMAGLIGMPVSVVTSVSRKGAALVDRFTEQNALPNSVPDNQVDQSPQEEPQLPIEDVAIAPAPSANAPDEASLGTSTALFVSTASLDQPTDSIPLGQAVSVADMTQESSINPIIDDVTLAQFGGAGSVDGAGKSLNSAGGSEITGNESITGDILPVPAALSSFAALGTPPIFRGDTNKSLQSLMELSGKVIGAESPSVDSAAVILQSHPDNSHFVASSGFSGQIADQGLTGEQTFPALMELKVIPAGVMASSDPAGSASVDNIASAVTSIPTSTSVVQAEVKSININSPISSLTATAAEKMSVTEMLAQQVKQAMTEIGASISSAQSIPVSPVTSSGFSGPAVGDPSAPTAIDAQGTALNSESEQTHTTTTAGEGKSLSQGAGLTNLPEVPGGSADTSVQGLLSNGDTTAIGVLGSAAVDLSVAHGEPSATVEAQGVTSSAVGQAPPTSTSLKNMISQTSSDETSKTGLHLDALARPGLTVAHGQPVLTGVNVNVRGNQNPAQGEDFPATSTSASLIVGNQGISGKTFSQEFSSINTDAATVASVLSPITISNVAIDSSVLHGEPALNIASVTSPSATLDIKTPGLLNLPTIQGPASKHTVDDTGPVATSRIGLAPVVSSFATGEAINTSPATATLAAPLVLNTGPHPFTTSMQIGKSVVVPITTTPTSGTTTQEVPSSSSSGIEITNFSSCGTLSTTAATAASESADITEAAAITQTAPTESTSTPPSSQPFSDQSTARPILPVVSPSPQAGPEQLVAKTAIGKSVLSSAVDTSASSGFSGSGVIEASETTAGATVTTGSTGSTAASVPTGSTGSTAASVPTGSTGSTAASVPTGSTGSTAASVPTGSTGSTAASVPTGSTGSTAASVPTGSTGSTAASVPTGSTETIETSVTSGSTGKIGQVVPKETTLPVQNNLKTQTVATDLIRAQGNTVDQQLHQGGVDTTSITEQQATNVIPGFVLALPLTSLLSPSAFQRFSGNLNSTNGGQSSSGNLLDNFSITSNPNQFVQLLRNFHLTQSPSAESVKPVETSFVKSLPASTSVTPKAQIGSSANSEIPSISTSSHVTPAPGTQVPNILAPTTPRLPSVSTSRPRVVSVVSPSGSLTFLPEDQARLTTSLGFGVPLQTAAGNAFSTSASTAIGLKSIQEPQLSKPGNTLKRESPSADLVMT